MSEDRAPQIPNYEVLECLGKGGMASVWLAQRTHSEQFCVIKVLHPSMMDTETAEQRFLREAHICALLDHPNIAHLYDAGRVDQTLYLSLEHIDGRDLEQILAAGAPLPPELVLTIAYGVLDALQYAHSFTDSEGEHLNIVHRDLSPRNVMVSFEGHIKLIDFGLVRTNLGAYRTQPGMLSGTAAYMSPEQASGEEVDRRSDIYGIGTVLYELFTGQQTIQYASLREALMAVILETPKPPSSLNPDLPVALDAVMRKALDKDPQTRFQSARELKSALAEVFADTQPMTSANIRAVMAERFPSSKPVLSTAPQNDLEDTAPATEQTRAGPSLVPDAPLAIQMAPTVAGPISPLLVEQVQPPVPISGILPAASPKRDYRQLIMGTILGASIMLIAVGVLWKLTPRIQEQEYIPAPPTAEAPRKIPVGPKASPVSVSEQKPPPKTAPAEALRPTRAPRKPKTSTPSPPPKPASLTQLYQRARALERAAKGRPSVQKRVESLLTRLFRVSTMKQPSPDRLRALESELDAVERTLASP